MIHAVCARRPSFLFFGIACGFGRCGVGAVGALRTFVDGGFSAAAADGVVSSHHVEDSGLALMSFGWFVAGFTRVVSIAAKSVRPAVVHAVGIGGLLGRFGGFVGCLESCLACCDFAELFLVGGLEVRWHVCPSAVRVWLLAPFLDGFLHDSTLFERC